MLQKYRKEDSLVLDHLQLLAIQKMIYLKIHATNYGVTACEYSLS
ncbi:MAG: hypothetical protein V4494_05670 [Chlamydiota bacterium]